MLKRNSQFTLIELIVVIVVLGILAAIVIPNISSFSKEARETQYTADARNVQTGYDMFTAKSVDLEAEALQFDVDATTGDETLRVVFAEKILNEDYDKDVEGSEKFIKITAGAQNHVVKTDADGKLVAADKDADEVGSQRFGLVDFDLLHPDYLRKVPKYVDRDVVINAGSLEFKDYKKKPVAAGVLLDVKGNSTAVVQFLTGDEEVKAASTGVTTVAPANLAVVR